MSEPNEGKHPSSTLTDYIEQNSKLISTLAIFVSMSVLETKLPDALLKTADDDTKFIGKAIPFVLFTLSLLVYVELLRNFKNFEYYGQLYWFKLLFFAFAAFCYLWVKTYYPVLRGLLGMMLLLLLIGLPFAFFQLVIRKVVHRASWLATQSQTTRETYIPMFGAMILMIVSFVLLRHVLR